MKKAVNKITLLNDPEMHSLAPLPSEDVWLENARTKSTETARYYKTDLLQGVDPTVASCSAIWTQTPYLQ